MSTSGPSENHSQMNPPSSNKARGAQATLQSKRLVTKCAQVRVDPQQRERSSPCSVQTYSQQRLHRHKPPHCRFGGFGSHNTARHPIGSDYLGALKLLECGDDCQAKWSIETLGVSGCLSGHLWGEVWFWSGGVFVSLMSTPPALNCQIRDCWHSTDAT